MKKSRGEMLLVTLKPPQPAVTNIKNAAERLSCKIFQCNLTKK